MAKNLGRLIARFATAFVLLATVLIVQPTLPAMAGTTNYVQKDQWLTNSPQYGMPHSCKIWENMWLAAGNYNWQTYISSIEYVYTESLSGQIWLGAGYYDVHFCLVPYDGWYHLLSELLPSNPDWDDVYQDIMPGLGSYEALPVEGYYRFGTSLTPLDW